MGCWVLTGDLFPLLSFSPLPDDGQLPKNGGGCPISGAAPPANGIRPIRGAPFPDIALRSIGMPTDARSVPKRPLL